MNRKLKDIPFHERAVESEDYDRNPRLRGAGTNLLNRQRGLAGSKVGPANAGRRLSDDERRKIEEQMRREGKL